MIPEPFESIWLDARQTLDVFELSRVCGMSTHDLDELVDYGALAPVQADQMERCFSATCVMSLRTASKLRADFDLDLFAVAVLLDYIDRVDALSRQVRALQAQLPS
jgi:chaperone modulatory protein CbpM